MLSLLQSPAGHLSNLSTTIRGDFEVLASAPSTVRPLETISLAVPRGLGDSDYTVLLDLSGTGDFATEDTIEVEGLTTEDDRILFASPLTQILPEANTSHRIAVRVRREADRATSNVVRYSIDEIASVAGPPGFATMVFEAIQKSLYSTADDPLLNLEAASIQPGLVTWSAAQLGVDTTFSDVLAEAFMQSLFGAPVTEIAPGAVAPASATDPVARHAGQLLSAFAPEPAIDPGANYFAGQVPSVSEDPGSDEKVQSLFCEFLDPLDICSTVKKMLSRVEEFNNDPQYRCDTGDSFDQAECLVKRRKAVQKVREGVVSDAGRGIVDGVTNAGISAVGGVVAGKLVSAGKGKIIRDLRKREGDEAAEKALKGMHNITTAKKYAEHGVKAYQVAKALGKDGETERSNSGRDIDKSGQMTKQGLQRNFQVLKSVVQSWKRNIEELIPRVEKYFSSVPNPDDNVRELFSVLMNDIARQTRKAETLDDLKGVYEEEQDPRDAIGNDPGRGVAVADKCRPGYREFPLEEGKLSTCVVESLIEEGCYKGSRQPSDVDLGGSGVCLYYSRDYVQPDGSCRENYKRVYFQGQWTCRWAELATDQPHYYTLEKGHTTESPGGSNSLSGSMTTHSAPEGLSATGYTVGNVPSPPGNPPSPPSTGGKSGCHGDRDEQNRRTGRWVCLYSGRVSFDTYRAGRYHGPFGSYDSQGRPDGPFGSRVDGKSDGVVAYFSASSGRVSFDTYRTGRYHGPFGSYDSQGRPDGPFGSRVDGKSDGVVVYFSASSGRVSFDTYRAGRYHGPFGSYDSQGRPDGSFGSRVDGKSDGVVVYFSASSGRVSFDTYRAGTYHGPSGSFNREGKRDGYFGSRANGRRTGTWTYYDDGEAKSTTTY